MDDYEDGGYVDLDRFAGHLERWFSVHFSTHDAALQPALVPGLDARLTAACSGRRRKA